MTVRKAVLAELFAILLVLYGGFLNQILMERETGLWLMTLGLLVGLFAVVQGLSSDSTRSTRVVEAPDTDSEGIGEWVSASSWYWWSRSSVSVV